jgi:hypothetical protein
MKERGDVEQKAIRMSAVVSEKLGRFQFGVDGVVVVRLCEVEVEVTAAVEAICEHDVARTFPGSDP